MSLQRCALALLAGSALGLTSVPRTADAAGIDATVSHRALKDGPVELELYAGEVIQTNPPAVSIHAGGVVRLTANNISKPTEVSCRIREANAASTEKTPLRVEEHLRKDGDLYATGKIITVSAGEYAPLKFVTVPGSKGSYVYSVESVDDVPLHFVDCTVRTLGNDTTSPVRRSADSAKASPRAGRSASPTARVSEGRTPRISGKRSLKRLSRRAVRKFERARKPARQHTQAKPATPPSSHDFGALQFVSESKQARIYTAEFASLTQDGLAVLGNDSVTAGIMVPSGKSAVLDCAVEVTSKSGSGVAMQVQHAGGATQTQTLDDGGQRLAFGVSRLIGLETITLRSIGSPYDSWVLGQCEVSFE